MQNYDETYLDPENYEIGRDVFDEDIINLTNFTSGKSVFEIGCGNGRFLKRLISQYQTLAVSGIDLSSIGIEICKKELTGDFYCADIFQFETKRIYDYVLCFNTLEHFLQPWLVLEKIQQLAKEKGIVYLTVPNMDLDVCDEHVQFWNVKTFYIFVSQYFTVESCQLFDKNQNILLKAWNI